jgi:hypothetical protein
VESKVIFSLPAEKPGTPVLAQLTEVVTENTARQLEEMPIDTCIVESFFIYPRDTIFTMEESTEPLHSTASLKDTIGKDLERFLTGLRTNFTARGLEII